jgi:aarF domain-containing kinase
VQDSVARLNFRTIVDGLGGVLFRYPFRVPAYYALILRSLTVLEGLALSADPNFKLLGAAYPYMAKRILTDPAPQLRASFEDLVLKDGRLRWGRLENLLTQGSQSSDFDPTQLWLLADWICSEGGRPLRGPLAAELSRLVDAAAATAIRKQVAGRLGDEMAERLMPAGPGEEATAARAGMVWRLVAGRAAGPMPTPAAGLLGLPGPGEAVAYLSQLQTAFEAAAPRLGEVLSTPGAQELVAEAQMGLARRVAARAVKLATGMAGGDAVQAAVGVAPAGRG